MTLADLADDVTVRIREKPIDQIAEGDVTRVFLSLYHTHIPALVAADMATYNRSQGIVTIGEAAEQAAPFLSLIDDKPTKAA